MSFFSVGVQEFGINSPIGFFGFKDILLEFKPSPFSLVLRGKFQVASFDAFSGDLAITQSGSDFLFGATVFRVCLVSFTVAGKLDLSNIGQSTIDAFKLGPDLDCLAKVGEAIVDGFKDAAAAAEKGLTDLKDKLEEACNGADKSGLDSFFSCKGASVAGGLLGMFNNAKNEITVAQVTTGTLEEVLGNIGVINCVFDADRLIEPYGSSEIDGFSDGYDRFSGSDTVFNDCQGRNHGCLPTSHQCKIDDTVECLQGKYPGTFEQCTKVVAYSESYYASPWDPGPSTYNYYYQQYKGWSFDLTDDKGCKKKAKFINTRPLQFGNKIRWTGTYFLKPQIWFV